MTKQEAQLVAKAIAEALQTAPERKLVDVTEGAKIANVHPATLKRWIRSGKIKNYSRGRKYLVNIEDLTN